MQGLSKWDVRRRISVLAPLLPLLPLPPPPPHALLLHRAACMGLLHRFTPAAQCRDGPQELLHVRSGQLLSRRECTTTNSGTEPPLMSQAASLEQWFEPRGHSLKEREGSHRVTENHILNTISVFMTVFSLKESDICETSPCNASHKISSRGTSFPQKQEKK